MMTSSDDASNHTSNEASNEATSRHYLIDALRGFALFGILVVNIQSFVWGVSAPTLAPLDATSTIADHHTVWWTAFLLEYKIYPIFCFCFGYGFMLMTSRWAAEGSDVNQRFQRRLQFMFFLGLFHGFVIWFGDILARYAMAGWFLRNHVNKTPAELWRITIKWLIAACILAISLALANALADSLLGETAADMAARDVSRIHEIYVYGSYIDTVVERASDFLWVLFSWLFLLPSAIVLFMLGAIVSQLGWLRDPAAHKPWLWRIFWISLAVGLPISWLQAESAVASSLAGAPEASAFDSLILNLAPLLAPAYVAAFALFATTAIGRRLLRLLEAPGKMALTNYLTQSLLMTALLSGVGLSLGDRGQWFIFILACAIFAGQILFSHVYLRFRTQGPMEALWRAYTYGAPRESR
jgi:uncharacterized protein